MAGSCGWCMVNFLTCQTVFKKNNSFLKFRLGRGFSLLSWGYDFPFMLVVGQPGISFWGLFPLTHSYSFFYLNSIVKVKQVVNLAPSFFFDNKLSLSLVDFGGDGHTVRHVALSSPTRDLTCTP